MPGNPNILINSATPEMLSSAEGLPIFFGWAERAHPQGVKDLVNLIGSILPQGGRATAREVRDGLTQESLEIGFETISSWLEDVGVGGFRQINLVKRKGLLTGAWAKGINLPAKEKISDEGIKVLKSFSACLKRAEGGERDAAKRVSPRRIVGDLLRESVGSKLSANGSANLREVLNKPLGGHFEWIREALGIADVAAQAGFTPKESAAKPVKKVEPVGRAEEISPVEREFQQKKARIRRYLLVEEGMKYLGRSWDNEQWKHVGIDGFSKRVYRPLKGVLTENGVCLRRNASGDIPSQALIASHHFREETAFLKRVQGPNFVRVYVHAPLNAKDNEGLGEFQESSHWELVDFIDGVLVNRVIDSERGAVWPERLTPAARLNVLLAACHCEHEATHLSPPVYLTDLKTDAFILQPNGVVRMVDVQAQDEDAEYSGKVIATELVRLCVELFPEGGEYGASDIERAVKGYLNPDWDKEDRKWSSASNQPPGLLGIINDSELPGGVGPELLEFLGNIRSGRLRFNQVPMDLARRILPIMQRLEREETVARGEEIAREAKEEARRRVEAVLATPEKPEEVLRRAAFRLVEISGQPASDERRQEAGRALAEFVNKLGELPDGAARQNAITKVLARTKLVGTPPGKFVSRVLMTAIDCGVNYPYVKGLLGERENIASAEILQYAMYMTLSSDSLKPYRRAESAGENLKLFITSLSGFSDAKARQRAVEEAVKGTRMEGADPGALVARVFMTAIEAGAKL